MNADVERGPSRVVTRDLVVEWMRVSDGSAAEFFEAVAIYFDIENEELEQS